MNVFLVRDEELHIIMMNPVMKILVSSAVFVTIFEVVVMIMVVEGMLDMRIACRR
jgi:cell division protein FtsX